MRLNGLGVGGGGGGLLSGNNRTFVSGGEFGIFDAFPGMKCIYKYIRGSK